MKKTIALLALAATAGCAGMSASADPPGMAARSPYQDPGVVVIDDDSLETSATIHTRDVNMPRRGFLAPVMSDVFLRAIVDKKTRTPLLQVYVESIHYGPWAFYRSANFGSPVQSVDVLRIDSDVSCSTASLCMHVEQVGFIVPDSTLRAAATVASADSTSAWPFRLKAQSGADLDMAVPRSEIAAFLDAVDNYIRQREPKSQ